MDSDERRFYEKIRPLASKMDLRIGRLENAVESGWPDVLVRGEPDIHIWLELKIAKGTQAKIRVRAEQINWAEDHYALGGRVFMLALNNLNHSQFWMIEAPQIRKAAVDGCLGLPCYPIRRIPQLLMRWQGYYVDIQPENPTSSKERPKLDFTPKRVIVTRAAMSRLRATRLPDSGHHGRPHHPALAGGRSRRV